MNSPTVFNLRGHHQQQQRKFVSTSFSVKMSSKSNEDSASSSKAKVAKLSKCPNRGCEVILERAELWEHVRNYCDYRLIRVCHYLGFSECWMDFRKEDLCSHVASAHNLLTVNIDDEMQQMGMHGRQRQTKWPPVLLVSENYVPLILKTKMNRYYIYWTLSALHSHEKIKDLKAKIKLVTDPDQVNSVTWKGAIIKLRKNVFDREALCVPLAKMIGLRYWMLHVKICSDTKRQAAEEIPQLDVEAPPPGPV